MEHTSDTQSTSPENKLPFQEEQAVSLPTETKKKRFSFRLSKKPVIITVIILVIALLAVGVFSRMAVRKPTAQPDTATAENGSIHVTISATGVIEPLSEREIVPQAQGEVLSAPFEIGQTVSKDQVLFTIDTKNVQENIEKSKNALDRSVSTYNQSKDALHDLTVYAPVTGVISKNYVKLGDDVQPGAKIADLINSDTMILTVPFLAAQADSLYEGQTAEVRMSDSFYTLNGLISKIPSGSVVSDQNVSVKNIEIKVQNPGGIKPGQTATAIAGSVACNEAGAFSYAEETTVVAKSAGTVKSLPCRTGDRVQNGAVIAVLESKTVQNTVEQNVYSVRDSELALESSYNQLDNYIVRSPISGTVITKDVTAGDVIGSSATKVILATIADLSELTFDVKIDELDIASVQVGQSVSVTADALPEKEFSAYVESIGIKGTAENGVTTYPVTIKMIDKEGLLPGMNVNAEIMVQQKEDVLTVPINAVMRGNKVVVQDASAQHEAQKPSASAELMSNGDPVPAGFVWKEVAIGLNDKDNIEIISGLASGDVVLIPTPKNSQNDAMNQMMMGPGGGSGSPEGRSGGGMQ